MRIEIGLSSTSDDKIGILTKIVKVVEAAQQQGLVLEGMELESTDEGLDSEE